MEKGEMVPGYVLFTASWLVLDRATSRRRDASRYCCLEVRDFFLESSRAIKQPSISCAKRADSLHHNDQGRWTRACETTIAFYNRVRQLQSQGSCFGKFTRDRANLIWNC